MRRTLLGFLFALALPVLAPASASAALLWTFSYTSVDPGTFVVGELITDTLVPDLVNGDYYRIIAVSGTRNGVPIGGIVPPGSLGGNDNKLLAIPPAVVLLDSAGFDFSVGGVTYNVFNVNGGPNCGTSFEYAETSIDECHAAAEILFTATLVGEAPEPRDLLLFLPPLAMLLALRRQGAPAPRSVTA